MVQYIQYDMGHTYFSSTHIRAIRLHFCVLISVNCKHAGNGSVTADVTQGQVQVAPHSGSDKVYAVPFTPTQAGKLLFTAKFNGIIIPGNLLSHRKNIYLIC